jgi:tetratricopeptide (TPR) repeat protein
VEARYGAQRRALMPVEGLEEAIEAGDLAALDAARQKHADSFGVHMALGHARLAAEDYPGAREAFSRAATLVPAATGPAGPRAMLAKVAEAAGDEPARRAALAVAIREHHTALEMARELLTLSRTADDRDGLRLAAERITEVDPFDSTAYSVVGRLALVDGRSQAAADAFRRALDAGPADPAAARTDLAEALLAAGQRQQAKEQALSALEVAPRYERAHDVLLAAIDGESAPRRP